MTKKSKLLISVVAIVLCAALAVGGTLAWFTDGAYSNNNVIQAGNLDVEFYWREGFTDEWINTDKANNEAIFDYALWEPGYTQVRYLKIVNAGSLAFQFGLQIVPNGEVTKLSDAIDVYYIKNPTQAVDTREDIANMLPLGTLTDLINGSVPVYGTMLPAGQEKDGSYSGEMTMAVVLKMRESAGNEYQGLSIGTDFSVALHAAQYMYEEDAFGSDYDSEASLPDFVFPEGSVDGSAASDVTVENGAVSSEVTLSGSKISATIPTGVAVADGTDKLTLSVSILQSSESNVTLEANEAMRALDVHIEGVSANNTVPMTVTLTEVAAKGLNKGNLKLYHVENGATVAMTQVDTVADLTAHNQYHYDPATGTITLSLATFSEVAVISDTTAAWEGKYDYTWYTGKTETASYTISNADQLAALGTIVGGMNGQTQYSFTGDTITLSANVNLNDGESKNDTTKIFYPIGYSYKDGDSDIQSFEGTFDGNGHTIANFYQNTWEMKGDYDAGYYKDGMGLFGYVVNGTVKNLTVDNFKSDGEFTPTGVIAAYAVNSTFENIAIVNCNPRVYNTGNGGIVGIGGNSNDPDTYNLTFNNITIDNTNKITALWGSWDVACGGLVGMFRGAGHVYMNNCHVAAQMDVYNDVCGNYQYYWYRYSGMLVGTNKNMTTDANGYTVPETDKFHAEDCTVHFGEWNDYYYCELVDNSLASYTHDHQFSRLTPVDDISKVTSDGHYVYFEDGTAKCHHIVNGKVHLHSDKGTEIVNGETVPVEDKVCVKLPFNQLFTGYGWGVKHIPVGEFPGVTILDREVAASVEKFETKFTGDFLYRVGNQNTVSLGSLFAAKDGMTINNSGVYVTIDKVDENSNVSGTFNNENKDGATDWTEATIQFSGTGVVKVTIQDYDYCEPTELYLEVVTAKNTTTASFSGNTVLLNDVSTSNTLSASGVVYGNGFTVNMENAPISEKNGAVFHLYDGAVLKNLGIVGKEFTTVALNVNDTDYGVSTVRAWGTATIENCYISGCRSAVSVTGTELTIKDSVIANGVYANVDFRSGILNLHNVTTINEPHAVNSKTVLGLGIVGNMTASAGRQINITGSLTQYNWVSQKDCENIKASGVSSIFNSVFTEDKYSALRYDYNGTQYVNTGILSLCSDFVAPSVTGAPSTYIGMDVTATISNVSVDGYVWAPGGSGTLSSADMQYHDAAYAWSSDNQSTSYIPPAFNFAESGLETEDGIVQISYESGSSYTLSADTIKKLLTPVKYGKELKYTVTMNGQDYTDKDIVFNASSSQTYTITYTITDDQVYDKSGALTGTSYEVTKDLKVFATVVDKGADAPTFTFYYGTNGSASAGTPHTTQPTNSYTSIIKQIGEAYYIMPNVSTTTANAIGSQTVDNVTVYYPIVDGINVRSGSSTDYDFTRYYPVFKAVGISDNGTVYSYSGTKEMPATVTWESATIDTGNGASSLNDGFGLYNNQYLCKIQKKAGDAEGGGTSVVKYAYTALDGNTYYYYVGYLFYDENEGCVTPDTLVTLANGQQVRVDSLTGSERLLVWNLQTGRLDSAPIMFVDNESEAEYEIIHLYFSDGTDVKVIYEHGFWDYTLNKYVYLDANAAQYIGHTFAKHSGNDLSKVMLTKVVLETEVTTAWSPVTADHLCYFVNGMLSMPGGVGGLFNIFDVDAATMTYDHEAMEQDIAKYGLFTYEELNSIEPLSEEMFEAAGGTYLKISIGKGNLTLDELVAMIRRYSKYFN